MDKKSFLASGLLEKYVLGLATPEECEEVIRHLRQFPELKGHLTSLESGISEYASKQGIPPLPGPPSGTAAKAWAVTLGILLIGSIVTATIFYRQGMATKAEYTGVVARLEQCSEQLAEEQSIHEALKNFQAFFNDTASLPLILEGKTDSKILVYWNELKEEARLKLFRLPGPPEKMQYQAWADIAGEMVSIGLLDYQFQGWQPIKCLKNAKSVNITLEPIGGSDHPSVDYLIANADIIK